MEKHGMEFLQEISQQTPRADCLIDVTRVPLSDRTKVRGISFATI